MRGTLLNGIPPPQRRVTSDDAANPRPTLTDGHPRTSGGSGSVPGGLHSMHVPLPQFLACRIAIPSPGPLTGVTEKGRKGGGIGMPSASARRPRRQPPVTASQEGRRNGEREGWPGCRQRPGDHGDSRLSRLTGGTEKRRTGRVGPDAVSVRAGHGDSHSRAAASTWLTVVSASNHTSTKRQRPTTRRPAGDPAYDERGGRCGNAAAVEITYRFPPRLGNLAQSARFPHSHSGSSIFGRGETPRPEDARLIRLRPGVRRCPTVTSST